MPMPINTIIEVVSVLLGLLFLIFLMRESIWCWSFGIVSSALSIYLFIEAQLYSESILYLFYVIIGIYGWIKWNQKEKKLPIQQWSIFKHLGAFGLGFIGAAALAAYFSNFTDAKNPVLDASTTSFSFVASFLESHKVLSAWIYWIIINLTSIWLYAMRGLEIYSCLMVVYFFLSILGYLQWRKRLKTQQV